MSKLPSLLIAPALLALLAGCPSKETPEPEPEIVDAGTIGLPTKPDCVVAAQGSKYAVCEPSFTTDGFVRTDRYEVTGNLVPLESEQRQRGERFVVVGGLSD